MTVGRERLQTEEEQTQAKCSTPVLGRLWDTGGTRMGPGSGKLMLTITVFQARPAPVMANLSHPELRGHSLCLPRFTTHPGTDKHSYSTQTTKQ